MDKIYKFLYKIVELWYWISIILGNAFLLDKLFKALHIEQYNGIKLIILIIIYGSLLYIYQKYKSKDKENNLSFIAVFINTINKVNYLSLNFINNIKLNELALIEFSFKNDNQVTIKLEDINSYINKEDIFNLDNYLNSKCKLKKLSQYTNYNEKLVETNSEQMKIKSLIIEFLNQKNG